MKRLLFTLKQDALLQFRYGLYWVSGFIILVWGGFASILPDSIQVHVGTIVPAFMMMNLIITTFYFMGALVLLEKAEGTLTALITTPLRSNEYLGAKIATLTVLAIVESGLIIVPFFSLGRHWELLLLGTILLGAIYTLVGFIAIVKYDSINEFLMPSVIWVLFLMLPMLHHLGGMPHWLFWIHPIEPALTLLHSAYQPFTLWKWIYGSIGSVGWLIVLFVWAQKHYAQVAFRASEN